MFDPAVHGHGPLGSVAEDADFSFEPRQVASFESGAGFGEQGRRTIAVALVQPQHAPSQRQPGGNGPPHTTIAGDGRGGVDVVDRAVEPILGEEYERPFESLRSYPSQ